MAREEVLALVATAVDNASPHIKAIQKSLQDLSKTDFGVHQKQMEKLRKELAALSGSTEGFRRSGVQVTEFGKRFQELSARAAAVSVGITRTFIPALASLGISTVTVASALTGLTIATQRYADASREASKLARETGFSSRFVQGIKGAAEELHVHGEQIGSILEDLSGKFQRFSLPGGGELGKNMALSRDFRSTFGEMRRIMADQNKPLDERNAQSLGVLIDRINELKRAGTPDVRLREMIKDLGLDPSLVDLASKNWATIKDRMEAYIKKVGELDPAKAKAYAEANRELARSFEGLSNAVGGELIGKLTDITNAISQFIDANKADINSGILREIKGIETAATSVISLFNQIKAATSFLQAPQPKEGEGRWEFFKRRWGLDGGDQKRRSQLPAEPSSVSPEVLEQMNGAEVLPEVRVTPPANPKYRAPFSPRSGQHLPKADNTPQQFVDGAAGYGPFSPNTGGLDSFLADSPMSSNIEDRRNGYVGEDGTEKALAANTSQLEVLNRLLDEWLRGGTGTGGTVAGGGSSGGAYRFTGGGAVAGPGGSGAMGGLPGLPTGGTGAPGGSGLFDRLQSPLGRRRREDGAFGQDQPGGPAPTFNRPTNQFTPGNQPFGPGNRFGPGSSLEKPPGVGSGSPISADAGADAGKDRLTIAHGGAGLHPDLVSDIREASKSLPEGWTARVESGAGPRERGGEHPKGNAADVRLYDEKGQKVGGESGWYQNPQTFRTYEKFAQDAKRAQTARDPNGPGFAWGGYFTNKGPGSYGFADLMHMQRGGPMAGGNWMDGATGVNRRWLDANGGQSFGMNDPQMSGPTKLAGPMPSAASAQIANLPTIPQAPGNLPAGALNPNATALGTGTGGKFLGGATAPNDPEAIAALNKVGAAHGLDPAAISAMVKTESGWDQSNVTGRYRGLTQIGPENPEWSRIGQMSKAENVETYDKWLDRYKFDDKLKAAGVDPSKMSTSQQAAMIQGFQFAPNSKSWLKGIAAGDDSNRATDTKQAAALGDTSMGAMTKYYDRLLAQNPAQYANDVKTLAARPSAPTLPDGAMSPGKLAGALPPKEDEEEATAGGFTPIPKPGGFTPVPGALSAKAQQASEMTHRVEGSGHIKVDVSAPRGTRASAKSDGMFKQVSLNRTMAGEQAPATQHASSEEE